MNQIIGQSEPKLIKELYGKLLVTDEVLEAMFRGAFEQKSITLYPHFLILTDQRLVVWIRAMFDEQFMSIPYAEISNCQSVIGMFSATLSFDYQKETYTFNSMTKSTLRLALDMIKSHSDPNYVPQQLSTDASPLEILQRRFALGEIDEEEYQRKLKVLDIQSVTTTTPSSKVCMACGTPSNLHDSKYCISCGSSL